MAIRDIVAHSRPELPQLIVNVEVTNKEVAPIYRYDVAFNKGIVVSDDIRRLVARWSVWPEQNQIGWLHHFFSSRATIPQVLECIRVKFIILTDHCHNIRQRIRSDIDAIRRSLKEISKFPLGTGHEFLPAHILKEEKAKFSPCLKAVTQALENVEAQCAYAEGQVLMVTHRAEREHRAFILEGLWTCGSSGQGRPNLAAIQKMLSAITSYQQELTSWQDFIYHEFTTLQGEIHSVEIRAFEKLDFKGWTQLKRKLDLIEFYKQDHFMQ